jgi:hypothetical protein
MTTTPATPTRDGTTPRDYHVHTITTPARTFAVSTTHDATLCVDCGVAAANAVALARCTGSRSASHEAGEHLAEAVTK